jgi:hypothetical protein
MSQNDTRAQRQREQDERRLSIQRNNAYFSYVSPTIPNADIERSITHSPGNLVLPTNQERARSCSPALLAPTQAPLPPTTTAGALPTARSISSSAAPAHALTESANAKPQETNGTAALRAKQNENVNKKAGSTWQTGMDRYITIKRKLSPKNSDSENKPKNTRDNSTLSNKVAPANTNSFVLLVDTAEDVPLGSVDIEPKKTKPPPIYIREKSTSGLVNTLIGLIGKDSFHIIPLVRGTINEIKLQTKTEDNYRKVTNYLTAQKTGFYTYQLKSSKGLQVVLKGIESDVTPEEITEALKEKGFCAKSVFNFKNRNRQPQPLFKIELVPENKHLKKNEVHPIYKLQLLLHRRITVEEPHKRNAPVQCTNCQEYGHTRSYCTLRPVCVVCGDLHDSTHCPTDKEKASEKKCNNCGGNHTANYRGCPIYKELKSRLHKRMNTARAHQGLSSQIPSETNPEVFFSKAASSAPWPTSNYKTTFANVLNSGMMPPNKNSQHQHEVHTKLETHQNYTPPEQQETKTEAMMQALQQSLMEFMTFMRTTIQDMMRNQNLLIQMLVSQQSNK